MVGEFVDKILMQMTGVIDDEQLVVLKQRMYMVLCQVIAKLTMFACNLESKYKRNCAQHDFNDEKWITFYFRRT